MLLSISRGMSDFVTVTLTFNCQVYTMQYTDILVLLIAIIGNQGSNISLNSGGIPWLFPHS